MNYKLQLMNRCVLSVIYKMLLIQRKNNLINFWHDTPFSNFDSQVKSINKFSSHCVLIGLIQRRTLSNLFCKSINKLSYKID